MAKTKGIIAVVIAALFFIATGAAASQQLGNHSEGQNGHGNGPGHRGYGYYKNH